MRKSAFPYTILDKRESQQQGKTVYFGQDEGISQRLYVATKIAAGLVSDNNNLISFGNKAEIIKESFEIADKLIKQDQNES